MTAPSMRLGTVTALVAGPPPRVTIGIGGDITSTVDAPYLDSYTPAVGDVVQVLTNQGAPLVLGTAALGPARIGGRNDSDVGSITGTEVTLVTLGSALQVDGLSDVVLRWSWDSVSSTVSGDRIGMRVKASLNGGAYTQVGRILVRVEAAAAAMAGGSGTLYLSTPAAGAWTYRLVAIRESGTGTFTVNGTGGSGMNPIVLTAERWT